MDTLFLLPIAFIILFLTLSLTVWGTVGARKDGHASRPEVKRTKPTLLKTPL